MNGKMYLQSEFGKGTSITFFVSLNKVQPNLNDQNNHKSIILTDNSFDRTECEYISLDANQNEYQLKKGLEKYEYMIRQSASRMRFRENHAS